MGPRSECGVADQADAAVGHRGNGKVDDHLHERVDSGADDLGEGGRKRGGGCRPQLCQMPLLHLSRVQRDCTRAAAPGHHQLIELGARGHVAVPDEVEQRPRTGVDVRDRVREDMAPFDDPVRDRIGELCCGVSSE